MSTAVTFTARHVRGAWTTRSPRSARSPRPRTSAARPRRALARRVGARRGRAAGAGADGPVGRARLGVRAGRRGRGRDARRACASRSATPASKPSSSHGLSNELVGGDATVERRAPGALLVLSPGPRPLAGVAPERPGTGRAGLYWWTGRTGGRLVVPGIARIGALAALGVAALTASAQRAHVRARSWSPVAVGSSRAFVTLTRASRASCTGASRATGSRVRDSRPSRVAGRGRRYRRCPPAPEPVDRRRGTAAPESRHRRSRLRARGAAAGEPSRAPQRRTPPSALPTSASPRRWTRTSSRWRCSSPRPLAGDVVAAHLWLEDPSSGTLRHVAAVGTMVPDAHPLPARRRPARASAVSGGRRAHDRRRRRARVRRALRRCGASPLPVQADEARGVAGGRLPSAEAPDTRRARRDSPPRSGPSLAGALALHVARTRDRDRRARSSQTARELTRRIDPDEVVAHALSRAMELSDAATGSVMLLDAGRRA